MSEPQFEVDWRSTLLSDAGLVRDAVTILNQSGLQIVLVTDEEKVLIGTITDGDIRRGLLKGINLEDSVKKILNRNFHYSNSRATEHEVQVQMRFNKLGQIPILNENGKVVGIHVWNHIATPVKRDNLFVVMAGGKGTRLSPITADCPKPMLRISGKPILLHILERARVDGFTNFIFATHYLGELIEEYFQNGSKFGVNIEYIRETKPLGTAGALSLLTNKLEFPIIVTNGDVITDISYRKMLDFHVSNGAVATIAIRIHEWQNPFGVVGTSGIDVTSYIEKPITYSQINAGVYVINGSALYGLPNATYTDMPTFLELLRLQGSKVIAYPIHEPWIDIGRPADFELAQNEILRTKHEDL